MPRTTLPRRFVDNDQGWRILEEASATAVRIAASKSGGTYESPNVPPVRMAVRRRLKHSIKKIKEVTR
jgi:hypothetical protein